MSLYPNQLDAIMKEYDQIRLRNKELQQQRIQEVYQRIPGYRDTDDLLASTAVALGRARIRGAKEEILSLTEQIHQLSAKKKEILRTNHYPEDYTEPVYTCPLCQDQGYIGNEKCTCLKQKIVDYLYSQSSIKEVLEKENFSHFSYAYYSDTAKDGKPSPRANMQSVVALVNDYIEHFPNIEKNNILFMGNAGVGKTFLSHCIAHELMNRAFSVLYLTSFQLFDLLKQHAFQKESLTQNTSVEHLFDCDLLIIDDLGTEMNNSFVSSQLFLCMNERLLRKKATIISTNLSLRQIAQAYSERILSRIMEHYQIFNIYGEDIRLLKAFGK